MSQFLFILGNTPQLSQLELNAVLQGKSTSASLFLWRPHLAAVNLPSVTAAQQLLRILGGSFKVLQILQPLSANFSQAQKEIAQHLKQLVQTEQIGGRLNFALTGLGTEHQFQPQAIKKLLRQEKISCRYRQADQWGASAAITEHETDFIDLLVVTKADNPQQLYLTQTVAAQDVDSWVKRDRDKPYAAGKKGMLPPKLARIMVNLGLGFYRQADNTYSNTANNQQVKSSPVLYDPFCGTGTVLMEALIRGCQVIGSDLDHEAVAGTLENLYWLEDYYQQQFQYQVFQTDAVHADQRQWQSQPNLIVTEPFLGKANPRPDQLKNIFKGLRSLYLGSFKTWTQILAKQAYVVTIFPYVKTKHKTYHLQDLIDKLTKYRYTLEVDPVEYYRQGATVKRQIMVFSYGTR